MTTEKTKDGKDVLSKKYDSLQSPVGGYKETTGDVFLETFLTGNYYTPGYIKRLRKCYGKVLKELNEVLKTALTSLAVTAGIAIATVITAGSFAPAIAVALVGSKFAGLSGAALTSACLAYSDTIFEQYVNNIAEIEKGLVELRLKADVASKEEKKRLKLEIKNAEDSVNAMKIAMKSMNKYKSAFN